MSMIRKAAIAACVTFSVQLAVVELLGLDVERSMAWLALFEITIVVYVTLFVMLINRPRSDIEWGTVDKEIAFAIIMAGSIYRVITGDLLPVWLAALVWSSAAILLLIYLIVFFDEWTDAAEMIARCRGACRRRWIVVGAVAVSLVVVTYAFFWI